MKQKFAWTTCAAIAVVVAMSCPQASSAQDVHSHAAMQAQANASSNGTGLLDVVRQYTDKYQDVAAAEAAGYALQFGCVSGDDTGAMGLHYVNATLVNSGVLDPTKPQILIYEAMPDGSKKLIGADFLVIADQWNMAHTEPPKLMGQWFHLFTSPNRFGLPAFYTLHVWAWKSNPSGAFVNWHPNVSCQSYSEQ